MWIFLSKITSEMPILLVYGGKHPRKQPHLPKSPTRFYSAAIRQGKRPVEHERTGIHRTVSEIRGTGTTGSVQQENQALKGRV